jgi:hypothetical protein
MLQFSQRTTNNGSICLKALRQIFSGKWGQLAIQNNNIQ